MRRALFSALFFLSALPALAAPRVTGANNSETPMGIDRYFRNGETGIQLLGTGFGATAGNVYFSTSPFSNASPTLLAQTPTSWSDTAVTFTGVGTGLSHGNHGFFYVQDSVGNISVIGFPCYFQATTPAIAAVAGSLHNGNVIAVSGSNFYTRPDFHGSPGGLVFMWSQFNTGSLTSNAYANRDWTWVGQGQNRTVWSSSSPRTTIAGDGFYRRQANTASNSEYLQTVMGSRNEYHYLSWVRFNILFASPPVGSSQVKLHRQYSNGAAQENVYLSYSNLNGKWVYANDGGLDPLISCTNVERPTAIDNAGGWHLIEQYFRKPSCPGCADGEFWEKVDNQTFFDYWHNFNVLHPQPCSANPDMSGEFRTGGGDFGNILQAGPSFDSGWGAGSFADGDDIYYDASRATVFLSTTSTFSASRGMEIQVPTAWSNGAISFVLNRGAIPDANLPFCYLYVVDPFGFVNEQGFQLRTSIFTGPPTLSGRVKITGSLTLH